MATFTVLYYSDPYGNSYSGDDPDTDYSMFPDIWDAVCIVSDETIEKYDLNELCRSTSHRYTPGRDDLISNFQKFLMANGISLGFSEGTSFKMSSIMAI